MQARRERERERERDRWGEEGGRKEGFFKRRWSHIRRGRDACLAFARFLWDDVNKTVIAVALLLGACMRARVHVYSAFFLKRALMKENVFEIVLYNFFVIL